MTQRSVLVINSGSSSIKYQLIDPETGKSLAQGLVEQISEPEGHAEHKTDGKVTAINRPIPDHVDGMAIVEQMFNQVGPQLEDAHIVGVGHRVVQGGRYFSGPAVIDEQVYQKIVDLCPLGPLHNPAHLKGIDAAKKILPNVPHVAVFDTAFFQSLPDEAAIYALNREVAEKYEIRRYGAHGTSHHYVSNKVSKLLGRNDLKQIVLHLGNGASVSAVEGDHALDTSMGLTPLEGLVMGTRTGDIDPAAVFHLAREAKMSVEEIDTLFNKQSGMKGLCGDNDMRNVRKLAESGDLHAKQTLGIYIHRLLHYVGAYYAVLGGLDTITFTAGVGENDARLRADLCDRLAFLGVELDPEKNTAHSKEPRVISADSSQVKVLVVPTNEELSIAEQVMTII